MVIFGQICPNLAKKRNFYGVHGVHGGHRITPLSVIELDQSFSDQEIEDYMNKMFRLM